MADGRECPEPDPRHYSAKLKRLLEEMAGHAGDAAKSHRPKARASFETTAEVLGDSKTVCENYARCSESPWQERNACTVVPGLSLRASSSDRGPNG